MARLADKNSRGQSLVELVVALTVAMLTLTGAVVLVINSLGSQSKKFDHKKATELASVIMEELVAEKNNSPASFWMLLALEGYNTKTGYDGYKYKVIVEPVTGNGCSATVNECANVVVSVVWDKDGDDDDTNADEVKMSRFFTRR